MSGNKNKKNKGFISKILSPITYKEKAPVEQFELLELPDEKQNADEKTDYKKALSTAIDDNLKTIKDLFKYQLNMDVVIREFKVSGQIRSFIIFMEGMADRTTINEFILRPLMILDKTNLQKDPDVFQYIYDSGLNINKALKVFDFKKAITEITSGNTMLFMDGCGFSVSMETIGFEKRQIDKTLTENVVHGPQEGFTENLRSNLAQLRRIIRTNKLVTEVIELNTENKLKAAIVYLDGVVNPELVKEAKRRISSVKADYILGEGMLMQLIEDHPFMLFPQLLETERPDRAASHIMEGKIVILSEGTPFGIVAPATFHTLIHSPEDSYIRWQYGTFIRIIRLLALFLSPMAPALYIAVTTYHMEMLPTELLTSIAQARENVPFPTFVEVLFMELTFELIREAATRIPGVVGNTLGIIGALILGQAAVSANIVSPVVIIIVAVTGLGNFALPNISVTYAVRILRFLFIILAGFYGLYGLGVGLVIIFGAVTAMKSFGVPFLAPLAPSTNKNPDIFFRLPLFMQENRPDFVQSPDTKRQPKVTRGWTQSSSKKGKKR